jgi:peptidoglycan/LPS O-acetylase OafA/YrhL
MRGSFEQRIKIANGAPSGFDHLRIGLSLAVLVWHCYAVSNYDDSNRLFWAGPWRALSAAILPMFFALSGFLVAGSLERTRLHQFAMLRLLRIIPALAFETVLVALFLGTIFTVLPLTVYFSSAEFYAYFLNIVGFIHYTLPGVFDGRMINAQLWTIPSELECYLALMVLALVGLTRRPAVFVGGLMVGAIAMTVFSISAGDQSPYAQLGGRVLVFSFMAGVAAYLYRDRIASDGRLFAICVVLAGALLSYRETSFLAAFPVAYATVWLGLTNPPRLPFGDLSYGVFLFHFPILQALHHGLGEATTMPVYVAAVLPLSVACAWISWTFVEKPLLSRKWRIIASIERAAMSLRNIIIPVATPKLP